MPLSESLTAQLEEVDNAALCDADKSLRVMDPAIRPVNHVERMIGQAFTVRCRDDFLTVIKALSEAQAGDILVIDAGSSKCAVSGEIFATEALRRGIKGIVIDGACRDTAKLQSIPLPVFARYVSPMAGTTDRLFTTKENISCGGVQISCGDIVSGDRDGVVVASSSELERVLPIAKEIQRKEAEILRRIESGEDLLTMLNFSEHCTAVESDHRSSKLTFVI